MVEKIAIYVHLTIECLLTGTPLERVHLHPLKLGTGCAAPVLKTQGRPLEAKNTRYRALFASNLHVHFVYLAFYDIIPGMGTLFSF